MFPWFVIDFKLIVHGLFSDVHRFHPILFVFPPHHASSFVVHAWHCCFGSSERWNSSKGCCQGSLLLHVNYYCFFPLPIRSFLLRNNCALELFFRDCFQGPIPICFNYYWFSSPSVATSLEISALHCSFASLHVTRLSGQKHAHASRAGPQAGSP